jgi:hypothetical protein
LSRFIATDWAAKIDAMTYWYSDDWYILNAILATFSRRRVLSNFCLLSF